MEINNFEKYFNGKSSRHHYIPRFLIEGFVNSEGLIYIFDKQKNEILKKPRSAKSIFFEMDRNTVEIKEGLNSSAIEDLIYLKVDNDASKFVKYFQNEELQKIEFTLENTSMFLYFLIMLFWRLPSSDYAVENILKNTVLTGGNIDPDFLKRDPAFKKMFRVGLFKHQINQMMEFGKSGTKSYNIHQSLEDEYIIADSPILFKRIPKFFSEFNEIDFLISLNSKRLYSATLEKLTNVSKLNSLRYNVASIHNSKRYSASGNLNLLVESVEMYRDFKDKGYLSFMAERAFLT